MSSLGCNQRGTSTYYALQQAVYCSFQPVLSQYNKQCMNLKNNKYLRLIKVARPETSKSYLG